MFLTTTHIFIVMEYASGGELFEFVKRSNRLSEDAARFFFQQLISGVDYCHQQARAHCCEILKFLPLASLWLHAPLAICCCMSREFGPSREL